MANSIDNLVAQLLHPSQPTRTLQVFREAQAIRATLITCLQSEALDAVVVSITSYLTDEDINVQARAMDLAMEIAPLRATPFALLFLTQPSWQFDMCHLFARYGGSYEAIEPLCRVLVTAEDPDTRYMAAVALGTLGNAQALSTLEYAQTHDVGHDHDQNPISLAAAEAIMIIREQ